MKRPTLRTTVMSVAVIGLAAVSTPASATHPHIIQTPGACVDKTGEGFGAGEAHTAPSFHEQVHTGGPGEIGFTQPNNPVSVFGNRTCP